METGILERIRLIMKEYHLSERQFALKIGISQQTLNNIFQRGSDDVRLSIITKILTTFEVIDTDWLVLGKGEMKRKDNDVLVTGLDAYTQMSEDLRVYRRMTNNLNDIIERQNHRIDELEIQVKNKQAATVDNE